MIRISGIQKRPIKAGIRPTPSCRLIILNVNLTLPSIGAIPIVLIRRPNAPPINPLRIDFDARVAIIVRPNTVSQKNSGGPNLREAFERGGDRKIRKSTPIRPPITDDIVAVTIAL